MPLHNTGRSLLLIFFCHQIAFTVTTTIAAIITTITTITTTITTITTTITTITTPQQCVMAHSELLERLPRADSFSPPVLDSGVPRDIPILLQPRHKGYLDFLISPIRRILNWPTTR
jgi:hypothetical protein